MFGLPREHGSPGNVDQANALVVADQLGRFELATISSPTTGRVRMSGVVW